MSLPDCSLLFLPSFWSMDPAECLEIQKAVAAGEMSLRRAVQKWYAIADDVDEWVEFWHGTAVGGELRDFLGLTTVQYSRWMKEPESLTALFAEEGPEPAVEATPVESRTFSTTDFIPFAYWGKDHWSTLAYLETIMVDCAGFQVGLDGRMKSNRRNFRVMSQECPRPKRPAGKSTSSAVVMRPEHSTKLLDGQRVADHDDWCCVQDMAFLDLFEQPAGVIEPGVVLTFSALGNEIANALREFKRNGGQFAQFRWPVSAVAPSPAVVP